MENQMEPRLYIGRHSLPIFRALWMVSGDGEGENPFLFTWTRLQPYQSSPALEGVGCTYADERPGFAAISPEPTQGPGPGPRGWAPFLLLVLGSAGPGPRLKHKFLARLSSRPGHVSNRGTRFCNTSAHPTAGAQGLAESRQPSLNSSRLRRPMKALTAPL